MVTLVAVAAVMVVAGCGSAAQEARPEGPASSEGAASSEAAVPSEGTAVSDAPVSSGGVVLPTGLSDVSQIFDAIDGYGGNIRFESPESGPLEVHANGDERYTEPDGEWLFVAASGKGV